MALRRVTYEMLQMLPKWMLMTQNEVSTGAQTLDTLGIQLDDLSLIIQTILRSGSIQMMESDMDFDLLSIDYLYKIELQEAVVNSTELFVEKLIDENTNNYQTLINSVNLFDFYTPGVDKFYYDIVSNSIYFKNKFRAVRINGAVYPGSLFEVHLVWGPLDEIGLLFGCPRIKYERNDSYKLRLMDVFANPGNATKEGLKNYISRSLGLSKEEVIIDSLDDDTYVNSLINEDGSLTTELQEFIDISKRINAFDLNSYWSILNETNKGLKYLPIVWDSGLDKWQDNLIQNGIGDTDDLEIIPPELEPNTQDFTYALYAEGLNYPDKKIYPEHRFRYKIYGDGYKYDDGYSPETFHYTVVASELIPLEFNIVADKIYGHEHDFDLSTDPVLTSQVSALNPYPNSNIITDNLVITRGQSVPNQPKRYIEVAVRMEATSSRVESPSIENINLEYSSGGLLKEINFTTAETVSYNPTTGEQIIGFEAVDNWNDAVVTGLKFRNDTEDSYRTEVQGDGILMLTKGEYQKTYNSAGEWDDGIKNKESVNVRVSASGNLRLSI